MQLNKKIIVIIMAAICNLIIFAQGGNGEIEELIEKLGSDNFEVRENATKKLIEMGKHALPYLRKSMKDEDLEVAERSEIIIQEIKRSFLKISISIDEKEYSVKTGPKASSKVKCKFTNEGDEDIIVLPPLYGSFEQWRQPFYSWKVIDSEGNVTIIKGHYPRDEYIYATPPYQTKDFKTLKRGETLVVLDREQEFCSYYITVPGKYKISLNYSFSRELETIIPSYDSHKEGVKKLMERALEVNIWSNEIEIEVE